MTNKKFILPLLFILLTLVNSCSKNSYGLNDGQGVQLRIEGVEFQTEASNKQASANGSIGSSSGVQTQYIPSTDDMAVFATLIPEDNNAAYDDNTASNDKIGASQTNIRELTVGTKFMVLVYDSNNKLVTEREYTYNHLTNNQDNQLKYENLVEGETYTFVVYSINSKNTLPTINKKETLTDASLPSVSTELLYFKKTVTVGPGLNYLNVQLKHQFSEVRATIDIDQTGTLEGSLLVDITTPTIAPSYQSATFQLANGKKVYNNAITGGSKLPVSLPSEGTKTITSDPIFIISDGEKSTFTIPSIRINQFVKSLHFTDFVLKPGVRYNLKVQIGCPCLAEAIPSGVLDVPTHTEDIGPHEYPFESADFGVEFDIYKIDNSINMHINDEPLYIGSYAESATGTKTPNNEIQFQGFGKYPDNNLFPNIEFEDGSAWGRAGIEDIFDMDGRKTIKVNNVEISDPAKSKPILKITVDRTGKVTMFGSKNKEGGGKFYPLRLVNERSVTLTFRENNRDVNRTKYIRGKFNEKIVWNSNGKNKVVISQKVNNTTFLYGNVSGKKIVPCSSLAKK